MKNKGIIFALVVILVVSSFKTSVVADGSAGHQAILREVLFGNEAGNSNAVIALLALHNACQLAIDHNQSENRLTDLKNYVSPKKKKIPNLPKSVKEFQGPGGSTHRSFTHKGWDYNYEKLDGADPAHWEDIRKKILLNTVNTVFDFGVLSGKPLVGYNNKCIRFAEMIYNIHIIHDHKTTMNFYDEYNEIPLIKGRGDKYGIIEELEECFKELFGDQVQDSNYRRILSKLSERKKAIKKFYNRRSELEDSENFNKYREEAEHLEECLKEYVPKLLAKEDFFKEVFY